MLKDKLFQRIGELTVQFATLEHRLQQLLEMLMGQGNNLIGPLFIHNLSLVTLLRKLRIVARYKVHKNSRFLYDLDRTVKAIDAIREERNLLIHGDWQIEEAETFPVKVRDFRMRYDQGNGQEFTETALTEKKVTRLVRRLKGLGNDVDHLIEELGNSRTAPQPASQTD